MKKYFLFSILMGLSDGQVRAENEAEKNIKTDIGIYANLSGEDSVRLFNALSIIATSKEMTGEDFKKKSVIRKVLETSDHGFKIECDKQTIIATSVVTTLCQIEVKGFQSSGYKFEFSATYNQLSVQLAEDETSGDAGKFYEALANADKVESAYGSSRYFYTTDGRYSFTCEKLAGLSEGKNPYLCRGEFQLKKSTSLP